MKNDDGCTDRVSPGGMTRREMVGTALKAGAGLIIAESLLRATAGAGYPGAHGIPTRGTDEIIQLPAPRKEIGMDLLAAINARKSSRSFAPRPLPLDILSTLLWAAFGINRPATGGRTAPSAHGWKEIDLYVALPEGLFKYEPGRHQLNRVAAEDLRGATGTQDFVAAAPLNLVYAADFTRMKGASDETRASYSAADAGVIAQNVYLFCAAAGLATVLRASVDRKKLAAAVGLGPDQNIVLAQTVGYPA